MLATHGVLLQLKFNINQMTKKEFVEKVKDILLIEGEVGNEERIKIDSLASLLLIGFYDENFGFKLSADTLTGINTIGDLVNLVEDQLN